MAKNKLPTKAGNGNTNEASDADEGVGVAPAKVPPQASLKECNDLVQRNRQRLIDEAADAAK